MREINDKLSPQSLIALCLILFLGCNPSASDLNGTCIVAVVGPFAGDQAALGREISRAVELVEKEAALKQGRLDVEFRTYDTASTPSIARSEVERITRNENIPVIVGSILSSETKEFLPHALSEGRVVIANGSSDPEIRTLPFRERRDGFFRNWPADDFEGRIMAEYIVETKDVSEIAVLHAADPYAAALAEAFGRSYRRLGGKVGEPIVYSVEETSFRTIVATIPSSADAIYMVGFPPDLASLYDTIRASRGVGNLPIFSGVGVNTTEFQELVSKELEGLFFTTPTVDEASSAYFDLRTKYQEEFGEDPDIVTSVSYDALTLALEAIQETGRCDAHGISAYLYEMEPRSLSSGLTGFDDYGDVTTKSVSINSYEHGRKILVETRSRAGEQ